MTNGQVFDKMIENLDRLSKASRDFLNEDLDQIWLYIARNASVEVAQSVIESITNTFVLLAANPGIGRHRPNLGEGMRSFPVHSYRIYYRRDARGIVRILHVRHAARDEKKLLSSE